MFGKKPEPKRPNGLRIAAKAQFIQRTLTVQQPARNVPAHVQAEWIGGKR